MDFYGMTDIGRYRAENQDYFVIKPLAEEVLLAAVCDGMGGAAGGKIASTLAADCFVRTVSELVLPILSTLSDNFDEALAIIEPILKKGAEEANAEVYHYAKDSIDLIGMGTTLVGLLLIGKRAFVCNVGDSRLYHITSGAMRQVTKDHSYVQMLIDTGMLQPHLAAAHPDRNVIMRAIGTKALVTSETFSLTLSPKESLLLCSDGLSGYVSNEEIYAALWGSEDIFLQASETKVKKLIDLANENGGRDNITAVLVTY